MYFTCEYFIRSLFIQNLNAPVSVSLVTTDDGIKTMPKRLEEIKNYAVCSEFSCTIPN